MARRNYSQELLKAQEDGRKVVCSVAPYEGLEMAYAPRRPRDPLPWVPADQYTRSGSYSGMYRYSGRQCHDVHPYLGEYVWYSPDVADPEDILCYPDPTEVKVLKVDDGNGKALVKAAQGLGPATVRLVRLTEHRPEV